jgi:hypothetical protein
MVSTAKGARLWWCILLFEKLRKKWLPYHYICLSMGGIPTWHKNWWYKEKILLGLGKKTDIHTAWFICVIVSVLVCCRYSHGGHTNDYSVNNGGAKLVLAVNHTVSPLCHTTYCMLPGYLPVEKKLAWEISHRMISQWKSDKAWVAWYSSE